MEIEYAKVLTKQENKDYFRNIIKSTSFKDTEKEEVIKMHESELINQYNIILSNIDKDYYLQDVLYNRKIKAMDTDTCICGGNVVVKTGCYGDFLSCESYNNQSIPHWIYKGYEINSPQRRIHKDYLTGIIKKVGLKGKLNAKKLLEFYESKGLVCLREYCGYGNARKHIDTLTGTKKKTNSFEVRMLEDLQLKYPVCIPQLGIKYREKGSYKMRHCFIDILCSNDKEVVIYECKTHSMYKDNEQKDKYLSLIKFIENKGRKVRFEYLIEEL